MKEVFALHRADNVLAAARTSGQTASRDNGDFAAQMGAQRAALEQRIAAEQRVDVAHRNAQRTDAMRDDVRREAGARTDAAGSTARSVEADRAEQGRTAALRAMSRRAAAPQDTASAGSAQLGAGPRTPSNNIESDPQRLASRSGGAAERGVQDRAQAGRNEAGRAGPPTDAAEAAEGAEFEQAVDAAEPGAAKREQAGQAVPAQTPLTAPMLAGNAAGLLAPWTHRAAAPAASMQKAGDPGKNAPDAVGKDSVSAGSRDSSPTQHPALPAAAPRTNASDFGNAREALPGAPGAERAGGAALAGRAAMSSGSDAAASFAGALASAHAAAAAPGPGIAEQPAPPVYTMQEPVGTPQFAPAMSERVVAMLSEGIQTAQITVSPPELGPVRIEVSLSGELASVAFSAVQPDTRLAIEQSLPVLGEMLAERGLRLDHSQVDSGAASFAQSGRFGQPGGSNEPQQRAASGSRAALHADDDEAAALRTVGRTGRIVGSDRLDVFA